MSDWKSYAGEMSDREVARRFGIGASTVRRFRHSSDIPKFFPGRAELPAALGFGGIAGASAGIAQILFVIFLILFVVAMLARALRGQPPV